MRMRRVLALLFALCCILSSLFSAAWAADLPPDLEDLGIDPWGDLGIIQQTPEPTSSPLIQEPVLIDPVLSDPDLVGEGGGLLYSLPSDSTPTFNVSLFPGEISGIIGSAFFTSWKNSNGIWTSSYKANVSKGTVSFHYEMGSIVVNISGYDLDVSKYESVIFSGVIQSDTYTNSNPTYYRYPKSVQVSLDGFNTILYSVTPESNGHFDMSRSFLSEELPSVITTVSLKFLYNYTGLTYSKSFNSASQQNLITFSVVIDPFSIVGKEIEQNPGGVDEETKGLLGSIISWLQNVVNAILQLPANIASAIIDGLKALFVPSEEDLQGLKAKYEDLLSERLGFIWQAGEWITSFGSDLLSAITGGSEAEFKFPGVGFDMQGEHYQLIEEQVIDFSGNGIVSVVRPFVGTIVALVVVAACVNLFHDMVGALISGKSYFDFLKGGGGDG